MKNLTIEQHEEVSKLISECGNVEYDDPYWFDELPDNDYCGSCALKIAEKDCFQMDGGFCCEFDSQPFCAQCGVPLSCTLTDYGKNEELEHYEASGMDISNKLHRYAIYNISGGFPHEHIERLYAVVNNKVGGDSMK